MRYKPKRTEGGQTLIELVIVSTVAIIIVGALTFASISSLRNASFSKHQTLATKLAQDGIERVRTLRDRNGLVKINNEDGFFVEVEFDTLWGKQFYVSCSGYGGVCYFNFDSAKQLVEVTDVNKEEIDDVSGDKRFRRVVKMSDQADCSEMGIPAGCHEYQKKVTVVVEWTDFAGVHQSELSTVLRNLNK